jgi:alkylhydroperoxidase/carboxymuconolactone decarboxylase family protein YurZ
MVKLDPRRADLKDRFVAIHNAWREQWALLLQRDIEYFEAYCDLSSVPTTSVVLTPKVRELVQVAVNASTTHLFLPGLRAHVVKALAAGATAEEIMEVYELTSLLGVHTLSVGVPALMDVMEERGLSAGSSGLSEAQEEIKATFIRNRGYWTDVWETVLRLSPDYFRAYSRFSSVPWVNGPLDPKVKEFIHLAVSASTTHLFEPGVRVHIRNAFNHGATAPEILEVLELVSLLGIHTISAGLPILEEVLTAVAESVGTPSSFDRASARVGLETPLS